uniref:NADH-ubiquinone oxidoreductase chain 2 n=1 Tax=Odontobutis sinensis TaxID=357168 RepID=U5KRG8_9GOBI|nr:NADH dehydrogenase subunit 2 [Odontobutis sinensis]AGT79961.1 NADH dehydrogenase subunit 2 [Odontobutis sinensis]QYK91610.1 NADH dehydrogenase subunit 2 [Odontobutis sinensis]QYK91623.1 NADH dehydrogenase subunit 2 [Odontobutis sinensis]
MSPYIYTLLLSSLGLGTTITFMSSHWFLAWMGLEINTLAIIPLMTQHHHPRATEAATKYFLTQATAASTLLFASTTNAWLTGQWDIQQTAHPIPALMILIALALKIGLAPLHTWLPEVLQGLNLSTGLILATWQKLAPFALLVQLPTLNQTIITAMALTSALVGGWGGLNQTQLRKILAYSSIAHLGWMILTLQYAPSLTLLALTIYIMMTFSAFLMFKLNNATNINSLSISWTKAPTLTAIAPLILLSLGGLPPFTGFMSKWLILQELTKQEIPLTAMFLAMTALLSMYFYLRLSYSITLTMSPNNTPGTAPWRISPSTPPLMISTFTMSTLLLLPLTPTTLTLLTF